MLNTVSLGDCGESYAIMQFIKKGAIVSKPLTNNVRYDLLVEINNKIYRVQVKTTTSIKDGKMEFATKTTNYVKGHWKSVAYSINEIDLFFLYCLENNWCGLFIPKDTIPQSLTIRLIPPKNGQKVGIRLANEYEFDYQYGSLLTQLVEQDTLNVKVEG